MKRVLYIDMDNVLVDFNSGVSKLDEQTKRKFAGRLDEVPGIFRKMLPMPDALDCVRKLSRHYDLYILSTAPWKNRTAWSDKLEWIKKHLSREGHKRLIITHHKDLNRGDFLVDDRKKNGAGRFSGELIRFGSKRFPNWASVTNYLMEKN